MGICSCCCCPRRLKDEELPLLTTRASPSRACVIDVVHIIAIGAPFTTLEELVSDVLTFAKRVVQFRRAVDDVCDTNRGFSGNDGEACRELLKYVSQLMSDCGPLCRSLSLLQLHDPESFKVLRDSSTVLEAWKETLNQRGKARFSDVCPHVVQASASSDSVFMGAKFIGSNEVYELVNGSLSELLGDDSKWIVVERDVQHAIGTGKPVSPSKADKMARKGVGRMDQAKAFVENVRTFSCLERMLQELRDALSRLLTKVEEME